MRTLLTGILFLLLHPGLSVAGPADSTAALQEKWWQYASQYPATHLFLHTDKNIYSPNERIWFKAYMLSGAVADSKVLYVRLLDANKKLMLRAAYPVYDIRAHGDLLLPDTLKDGNYFLYAYADQMYASQYPATHLFLHTDKNIYSPNERIWFKAYMLSGAVADSKVLYVRLLDANKKLMLRAAYPVYDIRAHGDLLLPDTLKDGNYFLYAYADQMINFSHAGCA